MKCAIPSAGSALPEADRARTSLDPIDSIGQLLSITVGRNVPAEGIENAQSFLKVSVARQR